MAALSIRAGVELTVKLAAMITTKQIRLMKVVRLELDGTLQSIPSSIEAVCRKALQEVNRAFRGKIAPESIP